MPKFYVHFRVECDSIRHVSESKTLIGRMSKCEYLHTKLVVGDGKETTLTREMAKKFENPADPARNEVELKDEGLEVPDGF